ncbi:type II secretion system protein N [Sphingomonas sp.]|uniref:type II secretion system protein N n=1 Tax=Sphingomonas sp. TaxID=28214 RepID=UPI0025E1B031|nr:type II secretion system protein N [Sphingomonas sp.]
MSRARALGVFAATLLVMLVLLCPLGAGVALTGLGQLGLSARAATGTMWSGSLADARLGPVPLGDVDVALRPLPLLAGRIELGVTGVSGTGRLIASSGSLGIGKVTAKLSLAQAFAPLPLDLIDLDEVTVRFVGLRCDSAEGRVRATFTGDVGGLDLSSGLSGAARCDGGELLLPLASQSGTQRLSLHVAGDGGWRAVLTVRVADPAMAEKLAAAGFRAIAGGYVLRLSGKV